MQKENKRCLPKGGRPHAQGVCQKKDREEKRCIPKEGMPHACKGMSKKKKREKSPQLITKEKESCKRVHP